MLYSTVNVVLHLNQGHVIPFIMKQPFCLSLFTVIDSIQKQTYNKYSAVPPPLCSSGVSPQEVTVLRISYREQVLQERPLPSNTAHDLIRVYDITLLHSESACVSVTWCRASAASSVVSIKVFPLRLLLVLFFASALEANCMAQSFPGTPLEWIQQCDFGAVYARQQV